MRRIEYIHERPDWPAFRWNRERVDTPLTAVRHQQGRLSGHMEALGFPLQREAVLKTLTEDVVKSSEIEGERLSVDHVRSSIARHLGMDVGAVAPMDRHVEGIVDMMLDATRHYEQPLTNERLFSWHGSLFPTNWELSTARASRVVRFLIQGGVPQQRLSAAGYAYLHPIASNATAEGRSRNRRVEIVLLRSGQGTAPLGGETP